MIKLKFIVYASHFNENSGGQIVLHRLCDLLNKNGEEAYIKPFYYKPLIELSKPIRSIYRVFRYIFYIVTGYIKINKNFNTPIYKGKIDEKCIVIYPEITSANPLDAKKVVRWFLHKPGFHTGEIKYGKDELYFFYQIIFNDEKINPNKDHLLRVVWFRDDIFKQTNFNKRNDSCYMLRKGKNRSIVHDTTNSILLDGKSNQEIAIIMNECEYFISYDMETMYSQYAVLCGCKSIVVPKEGITKEQWQPKKEFRYGIAYGFDDIEEAEKTKHMVSNILKNEEMNSNKSVEYFINKCYEYFGK